MFEIRPELAELLRIYKEIIEKTSNIDKINDTNVILFSAFSIIAIIYLGITIFKANKKVEGKPKYKIAIEPLIVLFIAALFLAMSFLSQMDIKYTSQAIDYYNSQNNNQDHIENSKKNIELLNRLYTNENLSETNPVATKFEKFKKHPFDLFSLVIDKVHYTQLKPAQDDNTPITEIKTMPNNQVPDLNVTKYKLKLSDIQIISIERNKDVVIIEKDYNIKTFIRIDDKWYKVNIKQEYLVNLVEGKTKYYYNSSENVIVVGTK